MPQCRNLLLSMACRDFVHFLFYARAILTIFWPLQWQALSVGKKEGQSEQATDPR